MTYLFISLPLPLITTLFSHKQQRSTREIGVRNKEKKKESEEQGQRERKRRKKQSEKERERVKDCRHENELEQTG